jgi:hypothetical protein
VKKPYQQELDELIEAMLVAEGKALQAMFHAPEEDIGIVASAQLALNARLADLEHMRDKRRAAASKG